MTSKKKQRLYIWTSLLLVSFFASAVVLVYQYLTNDFLSAGAATYKMLETEEEELGFFPQTENLIVDIEIYNEYYDEIIISNRQDFLADASNKDSGQWMNFGFDNIYQNWQLENIHNNGIYLQFRRKLNNTYVYSDYLFIPSKEIENSRSLTAALKDKSVNGVETTNCSYDVNKFKIQPYLRNYKGEWLAGHLKAGSTTVYEFPDLSYQAEVTMKAIAENKYEFIVNRLDKEAHFELWLRQSYDSVVIREDFVLADTWAMYQQAKEQEILLVDLCHFLRVYKDKNYIELYSQADYQGFKQVIYSDVPDFSYEFIGDNNIASIKAFGNVKVSVYSDLNYKGKKFEFGGNVNNFNATRIGNNSISSLKLLYLPVKEYLTLENLSVLYAEANENSTILEKELAAGQYEIVWHDNAWYKINLGNKREGWVYQEN